MLIYIKFRYKNQPAFHIISELRAWMSDQAVLFSEGLEKYLCKLQYLLFIGGNFDIEGCRLTCYKLS